MEILFVIIFFFVLLSLSSIVMLQMERRRFQAEQARFQASLNSINVGFMVTDTDSQVIMINTTAKQIIFNPGNTGSPAILRNSPGAYFHYTMDEIQASLNGSYDLKANISKALIQKTTISDKNIPLGQLFLHIFITPIVILDKKDGLGLDYIGAVVLIEDITQRLILERSKDEFFSIASHELRTPLTAIRGNTALIEQYYMKELSNPDLKEMIDDIHDSSSRLINIVNDFLDVSRLEQGRIEYHKSTLGILGLAHEVVKELATLATPKGLYLKIEAATPPPIVLADKERVKQVLMNLIGNALKFTDKGGVIVRFTTEGTEVKCSVIDTGKGIAPLNQKLLFHKFQQASDNILTRDVTGTGLGLYISKLMIEGQGGKVYLEASREGQGSIFSFTLPIIKNPDPQNASLLQAQPILTSINNLTAQSQT